MPILHEKNDQNAYFLENRTGFEEFRISKNPYFENSLDIHAVSWLASSNQCSSELVSSNSIKIKSSFGRVNKHFLPIYFLTI